MKDIVVRIGVIGPMSENVFKISSKSLPSSVFSDALRSRVQKILEDLTGTVYAYDEKLVNETDVLIINIVTGLKDWIMVEGAI